MKLIPGPQLTPLILPLHSPLLSGAAPVVGDRRDVFDQLDVQARGLQRGDRTFATAAGAFDADFDVTHAELLRLFGRLLSRALAGKRSAFPRSFESRRAGRGPAQCIAFGIGDGHRRVVERRVDVSNPVGDVSTDAFLFVGLCHGGV